MASTNFNMPSNTDGCALGAVATLTLFGGDMIAGQTNLVLQAILAPFDLIPLSLAISQRSIAGGTPTLGLYNLTDTTDIFANASTGATGVPVSNTTVVAANALVQKGDNMQLRGTTGGGVTMVGAQITLTYLSAGVPSNRTL